MTAGRSSVPEMAERYFGQMQQDIHRRTDRMFAGLILAQWVAGIVLAFTFSPTSWEGRTQSIHGHVWIALFLGGAISSLPVALAFLRPGWVGTRMVIASAQMLWSGLLIHLSGGRIETHFHIFGSLAFLGFYRDWRLYIPATLIVAADHVLRQVFWPESIFGQLNPEWWRFIEHAFWVVFEDTFMILACILAVKDLREVASQRATAEEASQGERIKSLELDAALAQVRKSQDALVRTEKLAAVGKLAASVGHELRNPLAAVRNAHTYIAKKITDPNAPAAGDARIKQFIEVVDRELNSCSRIISDLLDFARERPPELRPCPLHPLVEEAIALVPPRPTVAVSNDIAESLPVPNLDKDQFRQVIINLVQNAVEAIPADRNGQVWVRATGGGTEPWRIHVKDDGMGIPQESLTDIFQPLYTTKTKGTGLGLAIVAGMIQRHGGSIHVESLPGKGTEFTIQLPPLAVQQAA